GGGGVTRAEEGGGVGCGGGAGRGQRSGTSRGGTEGTTSGGTDALGLYELATEVVEGLWQRLGGVSREAVSVVDAMRWQFPRLARLASLKDDSPVSLSEALAEQARAIPDAPFFLWEGRAFSYREADARVNRVAHALAGAGVR